eukprot:COSAG06_NODE_6756_length_2795_cov_63.615727_1_plen_529_part_00
MKSDVSAALTIQDDTSTAVSYMTFVTTAATPSLTIHQSTAITNTVVGSKALSITGVAAQTADHLYIKSADITTAGTTPNFLLFELTAGTDILKVASDGAIASNVDKFTVSAAGAVTVNGGALTVQDGSGNDKVVISTAGAITAASDFTMNDGSDKFTVAVSSGNVVAAGTMTCTSLTETSDERWKTNIEDVTSALDSVLALRPVYYNWADDSPMAMTRNASSLPPLPQQLGFLAQQVRDALPREGQGVVVQLDEEGHLGLEYNRLTAVLVGAVQELTEAQTATDAAQAATIAAQAATVEGQAATIAELEAAVAILTNAMETQRVSHDEVIEAQNDWIEEQAATIEEHGETNEKRYRGSRAMDEALEARADGQSAMNSAHDEVDAALIGRIRDLRKSHEREVGVLRKSVEELRKGDEIVELRTQLQASDQRAQEQQQAMEAQQQASDQRAEEQQQAMEAQQQATEAQQQQAMEEQQQAMEEQRQAMEQQQQAMEEQQQAMEEQRQAMEQQQQAMEELREMVRLLADAKA